VRWPRARGLSARQGGDDEMILDAARACPVDAMTLIDEFEDQVWPQ
jgi:ferredoxin